MKFIRDNLERGLILAGRNETADYGIAIRALLGSYTNHNGLIVSDPKLGWCVAEAEPPKSTITPLSAYEDLMNHHDYKVRLWRVKAADNDSRYAASEYFRTHLIGVKYPRKLSMAKLIVFRFINSLPWKIRMHGKFCTQLVQEAWTFASKKEQNDPYRKPDGRMKLNPTPRTTENRLVRGVLEDVTDRCISK